MKVYLVIKHHGPDYQNVEKVYKRKIIAKNVAKRLKKKARNSMISYEVEELVVEGK